MSERGGAVMARAAEPARSAPGAEVAGAGGAALSPSDAAFALGVVREIPITAIEPDPSQPRRVFDEEKLRSLADSIRRHGLLQEPGVIELKPVGSGAPAHYRLVWGERRWRASQLAGLSTLRCKVFSAGASTADVDRLRMKERQWAENMEREGLSPVEEAIAILDAAELERRLRPEVALGALVEEIGERRGLHRTVARNLVALLKAPQSLQSALMARALGREVGCELARFWNKLLSQNALRGSAKREIQYRNLVAAWSRARGLELGAPAMARYAAETFQDPKIVKATCRQAEESERAILARFDEVVRRAVKERWTVAKTKAEVASMRSPRSLTAASAAAGSAASGTSPEATGAAT